MVLPFEHLSLPSQTGGALSPATELLLERFSPLITAQSLHLSVHQPERMDLVCRLTDKQPAASCFQASPDNSNSTFSPQMDGLLNCSAENSLCLPVFVFFCMFQCLRLFPLLTTEINTLI